MSFVKRASKITLRLRSGTIPGTQVTSIDLTGHRMEASIQKAGSTLGAGVLALRVWGMKKSDMSTFATNSLNAFAVRGDEIILAVGDVGRPLHQVFLGTILEGNIDYEGAPEVSFNIFARSGFNANLDAAAPNSYKVCDVARVMEAIARMQGWTFRNNGVTTQLSNQYLYGTAWAQLETLANAAQITAVVENGGLTIWPGNGRRDDVVIPINAENGMIGYPALKTPGVIVRTLFNPELAYGRQVELKSSVGPANGVFKIFGISHELSTDLPGGHWRSTLALSVFNQFGRNGAFY